MGSTKNRSDTIPLHNKWSKYILIFLAALVTVLIVWCICMIVGSLGSVKNITVIGESPYSDEHIIAVSELEVGMKIKYVDTRDIEDSVLDVLPCLSSVSVKKKLGGNIDINITSENIKYVADISGDRYVMSDDFRVLYEYGRIESEHIPLSVAMPDIKRAIVGKTIEFFDDSTYIDEFIGVLEESALNEKITFIDFSSKYALEILYDDKYTVRFGSLENIELKLEKVYLIMQDSALDGESKAIIDVSDISHPTVKLLT